MKVERTEVVYFKPVVITIETAEELDAINQALENWLADHEDGDENHGIIDKLYYEIPS